MQGAPILVVGAGPTGLTMACELARHRTPVRIVDKLPEIVPHCRATGIHSRTLEVFHDLGIVGEVVAMGQKLIGMNQYANGQRVMHARYEDLDSPYPFAISLEQCRTEAVLEGLLNRLGVQVERCTELVEMVDRLEAVTATLRHADGREETVETPWLVACDGAHSRVRHLNRQHFPGEADPYLYALADVVVEAPIVRDEVYTFLTDHGPLAMFPLPAEQTLIIAALSPQHDATAAAPTLAEIQDLVAERGPAGARVSQPRWLSYFRIHYRVTPHYRHGRTFLAGDAAHIHSPFAGQGMNTGIQDAYNLAWKLALVVQGRAPQSLLDSYEKERHAVAKDVVQMTKQITERTEAFSQLPGAARDKLYVHLVVPEPERRRMERHVEELDLDYGKSPIIAEHPGRRSARPRFAGGPHAGAQALDAHPLQVGGQATTLFDLLRGRKHTLLLFAGERDGQRARDRLSTLTASVIRGYGDLIDVYIVADGDRPAPADWPAKVAFIHDPERALHRRYGVTAESLYLIRPDGYVGYRSQPVTQSRMRQYLDRLFVPGS